MSAKLSAKRFLKRLPSVERGLGYWRYSRTSYSQFGEDMHILSYYARLHHVRGLKIDRGLFVDVGAFRPVTHSNSYAFYRRGWRSINIEPSPGSRVLFDKVRPRDTNLECAVGAVEGRKTFYIFGEPSVWNTMDHHAAQQTQEITGIIPKEISVDCLKLSTILQEFCKNDSLEVLSIDAEGYDLDVITSNDFSMFRPRVILIESNEFSIRDIATNQIVNYLQNQGYVMMSWINPNLMFVRDDSCIHL